ncbi:MAG: helix-turn-helix domain-containing protein, partial [Nesterenkonia sp.]
MNLQEARDALVALRQRKNLTQTDVANNLNTSQASIARIENANAELTWLTWKQVTRYASALGQKLTVSLVSAEPVLSLELGDVFQSAAGRSFLREHSCPDYVNITSPEGQAVQTIISGCVGIGKTHALARIAHLLRD